MSAMTPSANGKTLKVWTAANGSTMIDAGVFEGVDAALMIHHAGDRTGSATSYPGGSDVFTTAGLFYGFNNRNLEALQVLDELKRVVIDGTPEEIRRASGEPSLEEAFVRLLGTEEGLLA